MRCDSSGKKAVRLLLVVVGNAVCALAVTAFIVPSGFIMGGVTGIGLFLQQALGISVSAVVAICNVGLFLLGACFLGKRFAMTTLLSSVCYPSFLWLFQQFGALSDITKTPLLCMVYGGALIGAGIGLVLRQGASTGGTDIPPLILHKKLGLSVSACLTLIDVGVLALQLTVAGTEQILYGIITVFLYTTVLDRVLTFGKNQTQVKIISSKYSELNEAIQKKIWRGTTLLNGEGGHSGEEKKVLFSVVSNRELVQLKNIVEEIDPSAFLIINNVSEVSGLGFTIDKRPLMAQMKE